MAIKLRVDLLKLSKAVNIGIVALTLICFLAGVFVSFYFHFLTVAFLMLTVINFFYLHVQTRHSLLRNFGILAQFRYMAESIGPELRQYFFANDWEERPFARMDRSEVYRKSWNMESAGSYGTQQTYDASEIKLRHSMFPVSPSELGSYRLILGEERGCDQAYTMTRPMAISAMSFGALGEKAVRSLARGAKMAGIPMNTGEGGWPKYHLMEGCDLIFQMGTAKFGVRKEDGSLDDDKLARLAGFDQIRMVEIKFSQGAKPGKGGLLPKEKISEEIAELRGVPADRDVISPPTHVECTDVASTVHFITRVQEICGLPVGIKLCLGAPSEFGTLLDEMIRQNRYPDYISIDGGEGGTGGSPRSFMDHVGMPILPALFTVDHMLRERGVRDRLKLMAAGKLINAGRMLTAMALGADAIYTARGFMLSLGCVQAMQCAHNTCPIGITTHDPHLQSGMVIPIKAQRVANYVRNIDHEMGEMLAATGCRRPHDLSLANLWVPHDTPLYDAVHELRPQAVP